MRRNDEQFSHACMLSGEELKRFLDGLDESARISIQQRLADRDAENADPFENQQKDDGNVTPNAQEFATIDPESCQTPGEIPRRTGAKADAVPDFIGPYRVIASIGRGGMGQVYRAEQLEPIRRQVALKVISADAPTDLILARFEAERQALAMMDHQNIAKVLDAGIDERGKPFFAMELVKGIPITDYCDQSRLATRDRLCLFIQVCRAIQHAHQKGVIHRDLKPSNVLVTSYDGKPVAKVIDFGLAKAVHDQIQLANKTLFTQQGQVLGTLEYMSPEQARLNALDVDTRTDVYSLGVIFYELLTGTTPVGRERLRSRAFDQILAVIREEDAIRPSLRLSSAGDKLSTIAEQRRTDPRTLRIQVSGDLDCIAIRALEKDRTRRYQGAGSFADDIERYLQNDPVEARPPSVVYLAKKSFAKHRARYFWFAGLVCTLIVGFAGTLMMWRRAVEAEQVAVARAEAATKSKHLESVARYEAEKSRDRASLAMEEARASQAHAEQTYARSQFNAAKAQFSSLQFSQCIESLSQIPEQYRHVEWYLARERYLGAEHVMEAFKPQLNTLNLTGIFEGFEIASLMVAFTADGSQVVASDPYTVHFFDAGSGKPWRSITRDELDPLAHELEADFDDFDLESRLDGEPLMLRKEVALAYDIVGPPQFSNIFARQQVLIAAELLLLDEGKATSLLTSDHVLGSFVGTKGISLVTQRAQEQVQIVNGHDAKLIQSLEFGYDEEVDVEQANFTSDGSTVALLVLPTDGVDLEAEPASVEELELNAALGINEETKSRRMRIELFVWDLTSNKIVQSFVAPSKSHFITGSAFDPSGTRIAVTDTTGAIRLFDWKSGKLIRTLLGHTGPSIACFSPDGSRVASVGLDGTVRCWNLRATDHASKLGDIKCLSLTFGPEGRNLALGCMDGTIRCWNVDDRTFYKRRMSSDRPIDSVDWSPDGKLIASFSPGHQPVVWDVETGVIRSEGSQEFVADRDSGVKPKTQTRKVSNSLLGSLFSSLFGPPAPARIRETVNRVLFSPGGTLLADTGNTVPRLLDPLTGEEVGVLEYPEHKVREFAFAPDGESCAGISPEGKVCIWEVATGKRLVVAERPQLKSSERFDRTSIHTIAYSPSGKIAFPSQTHGVEIYDTDLEKRLATFEGHSDTVTTIAFSADGSRMVTGSLDNTIKIWDTSSQEELFSLPGHATHVRKVAISPDGYCIASLGDDGIVKIWDARSRAVAKESDGRLRGNGITGSQTADLVSDPLWRMKQADRAFEIGNTYAGAFHLGWLCREQGATDSIRQRLRSAIAKLSDAQRGHLPPFIVAFVDKD